jgi:hypothetical protein
MNQNCSLSGQMGLYRNLRYGDTRLASQQSTTAVCNGQNAPVCALPVSASYDASCCQRDSSGGVMTVHYCKRRTRNVTVKIKVKSHEINFKCDFKAFFWNEPVKWKYRPQGVLRVSCVSVSPSEVLSPKLLNGFRLKLVLEYTSEAEWFFFAVIGALKPQLYVKKINGSSCNTLTTDEMQTVQLNCFAMLAFLRRRKHWHYDIQNTRPQVIFRHLNVSLHWSTRILLNCSRRKQGRFMCRVAGSVPE